MFKRLSLGIIVALLVSWAVPCIAQDANTLLLMHQDGTAASQVFIDSSEYVRTLTAQGDTQIDTVDVKFGTGAGYYDGTGDAVTIPDSDAWTLGTDDFTFDTWIYYDSVTEETQTHFMITSSGYMNLRYLNGGTYEAVIASVAYDYSYTPAASTWSHIAWVRYNEVLTFYFNGESKDTPLACTGNITNSAGGLIVGNESDYSTGIHGNFDETRFSNVARWTSNFTPPDAPYGEATAGKSIIIRLKERR